MPTYSLQPQSVRKLFDSVAPRYDLLNHLLSLRRDIFWRRTAVSELTGIAGWILDVATGTGDAAIEILKGQREERRVMGIDFSEPMVRVARKKVERARMTEHIFLALGDALSLPFRDNTFGASVVTFGLRNMLAKENALSEMVRVTQKGGKVIVLEFAFPRRRAIKEIYSIYFMKILPWVGGRISGDRGAYRYLPESVSHFRNPEDYEALMRRAGLEILTSRRLTFGIASVMVGMKKNP